MEMEMFNIRIVSLITHYWLEHPSPQEVSSSYPVNTLTKYEDRQYLHYNYIYKLYLLSGRYVFALHITGKYALRKCII